MWLLLLILLIVGAFKLMGKAAPYVVLAAVLTYLYYLVKGIFSFIWRVVSSTPGIITIITIALIVIVYFIVKANRCDVCNNKYKSDELVHIQNGKVCTDCLQKIGVDYTALPKDVLVEKTLTVQEIEDLRDSNTIIDPIQRWENYQEQQKAKEQAANSANIVPTNIGSSEVDELHELKQLLDDGVITQDDFDAKKRQILGL